MTQAPTAGGDDSALPCYGLAATTRRPGRVSFAERKWVNFAERRGSRAFKGLGRPAALRLLHRNGVYYVAVNHAGVADELEKRWQALPPRTEPIPPPAFRHFAVPDTAPLQDLIRDVYRLARALPPEPLRMFVAQTAGLPESTEAERLVVQRIGQDMFRAALDIYWEGRCAVTGVCASAACCGRAI